MDLKKLQRMIVSDSVALRIAPANLSMNEVRRYIQGKRNQIHNVDAWLSYDGQSPGPPGDGWYKNQCRNMKIEVFRTKAEGNKITHLKLSGQMPPDLHDLVPSLTHLSIDCLTPNEHPKLERYIHFAHKCVLIKQGQYFAVTHLTNLSYPQALIQK